MGTRTKGLTSLPVVSYERLQAADDEEIRKLVRLSCDTGLFSLDLRCLKGSELLADIRQVMSAQREFFSRSFEQKEIYRIDASENGYQRDENPLVEIYGMSSEAALLDKLTLPPDLAAVRSNIASMVFATERILQDIYRLLGESLELETQEWDFTNKSNLEMASTTAAVGTAIMPAHIDDGGLTIMYCDVSMLEVQEMDEWRAVSPLEGRYVVNIGKSLETLSRGRLKAAPHRVIQAEKRNEAIIYYMYPGSQ